ncbi:uncharacterized protein LOC135373436 [Ornithodoros turicata]|uniref:uncharacterized protein LOC135373436 n=1 Tax=Ornithodoros turicata TaxID=34597 RepID=UPI0031391C4D
MWTIDRPVIQPAIPDLPRKHEAPPVEAHQLSLAHINSVVFGSVPASFLWPLWQRSCLLPTASPCKVHIDLVGPLALSKGNSYILTCVDRFTRWPEATPIPDATAPTVATAFLATWVARFGVPEEVVTGRGTQFESALFHAFTSAPGTERLRTSAYPACNGLVERFHRHMKQAIMAQNSRDHWTETLPLVLLGIRSALKSDLGCSSAELVYGAPLRLPADVLKPPPQPVHPSTFVTQLWNAFATLQFTPTRASSAAPPFIPTELHSTTHVLLRTDRLRRALEPPYSGPYKVLQRASKTFLLDVRGRPESVSIDRLKPAFLDNIAPAHYPDPSLPPDIVTPPRPPRRVTWASTALAPTRSSGTLDEGHM